MYYLLKKQNKTKLCLPKVRDSEHSVNSQRRPEAKTQVFTQGCCYFLPGQILHKEKELKQCAFILSTLIKLLGELSGRSGHGAAHLLHHSVVVAAGAFMLLWLVTPLLGTRKNKHAVGDSHGQLLGKHHPLKSNTHSVLSFNTQVAQDIHIFFKLWKDTRGHALLLGLCRKCRATLDSTRLFSMVQGYPEIHLNFDFVANFLGE